MRQRSSEARATFRRLGLALAAAALVGAAISATAFGGEKSAAISPPPSPNCHLENGIQHVIEITFDNTHFFRDNPNVLSDLEQMPALKDFITNNGTMLSNNYTPLIAHTADDSLTNYSGLYGDRHGQGIGNSYETYVNGDPNNSKSSFAYWTGTYNSTRTRTCRTRRSCRRPTRRRRRPRRGSRSRGPVVTSATSRRRTWSSRTSTPTSRTSSGRTRRRSRS